MLQLACVLTTGGIILFSSALCPDPQIFSIIIHKILQSKLDQCQLFHNMYKFQYTYEASIGLIFVAVWRNQILLQYVDKFLHYFKNQIKENYQKISWKGDVIIDCPQFSPEFNAAFQKWNLYAQDRNQKDKVMTKFQDTDKGKKIKKKQQKKEQKKEQQTETNQTNNANSEGSLSPRESINQDNDLSPRQRFLRKQQQRNKQNKKKKAQKSEIKQEKNNQRFWETSNKHLSKSQIASLDRSKIRNSQQSSKIGLYDQQGQQKPIYGFVESDQQVQQSTFFKKIVGSVQGVIGNKNITSQDLKPILLIFKQKLMEKNVAQQVAEKVADSVGQTLLQTKTKTFTSVQTTVKNALKQALVKILTPKRHIDLVAEVSKSKLEHKPYVVVFIGVNGVGKSTNLAKVAYLLKNSKFSVMLAACDNFRAGAVQQIKVHGKNLDIPVFDRGYKQQPPEIAYQAIKQAVAKRIDVVLIDTAGRMQDNVPLMKALARLVSVNKPNLVVFIGQALVGNDAIDQITKFNQAISEYSNDDSRRQIDAILLSKFDTVDDKVGTAVTMCYATSKPILYVGVGQKYQNLKKLNINTMVHALMS